MAFGHRKVEEKEKTKILLEEKIENLVCLGFDTFYFGGFGEFDEMYYQVVSKVKNRHKNIRRVFVCPNERWLRRKIRPKWLKEEDYEDLVYLPLDYEYWYTSIYYRNLEMIKEADIILFYVRKTDNSGAFKALQAAKKLKKRIILL